MTQTALVMSYVFDSLKNNHYKESFVTNLKGQFVIQNTLVLLHVFNPLNKTVLKESYVYHLSYTGHTICF